MVKIPGAVCGSDTPLAWGGGVVTHSAIWPWWPAVGYDVSGPFFDIGDVNGDGQDDAYFRVDCNTTGGTGEGVFSTAVVVFEAKPTLEGGHSSPLRLLGIVTPR